MASKRKRSDPDPTIWDLSTCAQMKLELLKLENLPPPVVLSPNAECFFCTPYEREDSMGVCGVCYICSRKYCEVHGGAHILSCETMDPHTCLLDSTGGCQYWYQPCEECFISAQKNKKAAVTSISVGGGFLYFNTNLV